MFEINAHLQYEGITIEVDSSKEYEYQAIKMAAISDEEELKDEY